MSHSRSRRLSSWRGWLIQTVAVPIVLVAGLFVIDSLVPLPPFVVVMLVLGGVFYVVSNALVLR